MVGPWLGVGLVLAALGALLAGLRLFQRLADPHPELVRKLLHMGMGLVTLSFPWLFDKAWPVLLLAGLSVALLLALRLVRALRSTVGNVVGAVRRVSLGDVYFPVAVAVLFLLYLNEPAEPAGRREVLYAVPILLLTLADAVAALVGVSYGRHLYLTSDGRKSAEGSVAFFACAFFCVHVPVLLYTDTGRPQTLLIALLLAWLATLFEAIAWNGLDNLVLPLVSFLLLKIYLGMSEEQLAVRLAATAAMVAFLLVYYPRSTLVGSAVLGAFVVGYITWALGSGLTYLGVLWLLPPLILFVSYTLLSPQTEVNARRVHNVHAVACVASAGLLWLFLAIIFDMPQLVFPYALSYAAHLAIIGTARLGYQYPWMSGPTLLAVSVLKGWLFIFGPFCLACALEHGLSPALLACPLAGLAGVTLAAVAFYVTQPEVRNCPADTPRWVRQAAGAGLGSLVALVPLYLVA